MIRTADFAGTDFLSMRDFDREQLLELLRHCGRFEQHKEPVLRGRLLGSLFFEPSTRTRLSFESAMKRLGGQTVGFSDVVSTSVSKGESLWDTIRVVEGYCDAILIRHPKEGAARLAAEATGKPVINGGDGSNQHPTQTMLDLYTIHKRAGRLEDLKVAFIGDLKYGRTVHSLIRTLSLFGADMWLVAPPSLRLPGHFLEDLKELGAQFQEVEDLQACPGDLDILYMTRIQEERFPDPIELEQVRNSYQLDQDSVAPFREDVTILHPLPRTTELDRALDKHPGAAWFDQAHNGVIVRMTLLALLMGAA